MKRKEAKYLAVFIYGLALIGVAAVGAVASLYRYASDPERQYGAAAILRGITAPGYVDAGKLAQTILLSIIVLIPLAGLAAILVFKKACSELRDASGENVKLKEQNQLMNETCGTREQRVQLLTKLTGRIALEFCNLITPVVGRALQLRARVPAEDPIRADIDEIYGVSRHAMDILQQFVVIGGGWRDNSRVAMPLKELMPQIVGATGEAKPENIEIIEDYDFKDEQIMGNKSQIINAFNNLCANSYEAIAAINEDDGDRIGHIWFKGYMVLRGGARYARICVEDDGAGIDSRLTASIFEPFFTTKRAGEGAGLGLTIVKNIVENHNGVVGVSSASGRGSVFTVDLPVISKGELNMKQIERKRETNAPAPGGAQSATAGRGENMKTSPDNPAMTEGTDNSREGNNYMKSETEAYRNRHLRPVRPVNENRNDKPDAAPNAYGRHIAAQKAAQYSYERQLAAQRAARSEYRLKVLRGGAAQGSAQNAAQGSAQNASPGSAQNASPGVTQSSAQNLKGVSEEGTGRGLTLDTSRGTGENTTLENNGGASADNNDGASADNNDGATARGAAPAPKLSSARAEGLARGIYLLGGANEAPGSRNAESDASRFMRTDMSNLKWSPVAAEIRSYNRMGARRAAEPSSVVVIDSHRAVLNTIKNKLTDSGYAVRTYESPFDALEAMKGEPCNVLIAANKLRNMSGSTMAELAKANGGASHIFLMLENSENDATNLIKKERIDGFLIKPVSANELLDKLGTVVDAPAPKPADD